MTIRRHLFCMLLAGACTAALATPAGAQEGSPNTAADGASASAPAQQGNAADTEESRGVHIIDEPAAPAPGKVPEMAPVSAPQPEPGTEPAAGPPPAQNAELPTLRLRTDNSAGVGIEIVQGNRLRVGSKITFKVETKKAGYLVLVDIDPTGKLTQIYPNRSSLLALGGRENANLVRPGRTIMIPDSSNPYAGFELIASPPNGVAMIMAILSDRPVNLLDLPDVPTQFAGQQAAVDYVSDIARSLRITRADETQMVEPKWSFDAKLYVVQ